MQTPSQHKIGNHPGPPPLSIAPGRNVFFTFSKCQENPSTDPPTDRAASTRAAATMYGLPKE